MGSASLHVCMHACAHVEVLGLARYFHQWITFSSSICSTRRPGVRRHNEHSMSHLTCSSIGCNGFKHAYSMLYVSFKHDFGMSYVSTSPALASPAREEEDEGRAAALVVGGLLRVAVHVGGKQAKKHKIYLSV